MNRSHTSSRRTGPWLAAAALVLLAWLLLSPRSTTIFDADSPFGRVRVMERADGLRTLVTGAGRARQSAIFPGRPWHLELAYTRVGAIGLALAPPDARILFVGLGGGAMPMFARHVLPDARIDVVEIDPLIVDVAQRYFGFTPDDRMRVHTADGRAFIEQAPAGSWDLIVLDAFSDDEVPFALTTRQFLEAVRSRLAPDGIVISNLWSRSPAYPAMLATYLDVFPHVDLLRVPRRNQLILVAAPPARPLGRERLLRAAAALAGRVDLGFDLTRLTSGAYRPARRPDAPVLDDSLAADLRNRSPEDPMALHLDSPAFDHNGAIPRPHTCDGADEPPPLRWTGVPSGTRSLALIVDDPDAPDPDAPRRVFVHWVLYDIPPHAAGIADGTLPEGTRAGTNDNETTRYSGPCPPIGRHRYFFKLYALDTAFGDMHHPSKAKLERAMQNHILDRAELIGTYERPGAPDAA